MNAEVLAVGAELLDGDIVNTNAAWLGERLTEVGIPVTRSTVVGDNIDVIAAGVIDALSRCDVLVVTGGLGPTQDDLTREGLARAAGISLHRDESLMTWLRELFATRNRPVPELNFRQADLPEGATALPNTSGTAPGLRLEIGRSVVYAVPGVPREMQPMVLDHVLPDLRTRAGVGGVIGRRVLRTAGVWESHVAEALADQVSRLQRDGDVTVAFLASEGLTRVKFTASAPSADVVHALLAREEQVARDALGDAVYGVDDDTLDACVLDLLRARGESVAVAESLTGGLVLELLTSSTGASDVVRGGVVAYTAEMKTALLGVPAQLIVEHGVVSDQVATAMATGVQHRCAATYALALTGVAGPDAHDGKDPGTVHIALAHPGGIVNRSLRFRGDRGRNRHFSAVTALDLLRRHLIGALVT